MGYRSRDRVRATLAHREPDRVPYCAIHNEQIAGLITAMALPPDHRALCAEGDFAFVHIESQVQADTFKPYLGELPANARIS